MPNSTDNPVAYLDDLDIGRCILGHDAVLLHTDGGGLRLYARQAGELHLLGDFDDPASALNVLDSR